MKKHILGFLLLNLIVVSFALNYSLFYAPPIPSIETVKLPASEPEVPAERPNGWELKKNRISYEVEKPELYFQEGRFVSKLNLKWNGEGKKPTSVYVKARIFDKNKPDNVNFVTSESFSNVFEYGSNVMLTFNQKFVYSSKELNEKSNYSVIFEFSEQYSNKNSLFDKDKLGEAVSIRNIYGKIFQEDYIIFGKGTSVPE